MWFCLLSPPFRYQKTSEWPSNYPHTTINAISDTLIFLRFVSKKFQILFSTFLRFRFRISIFWSRISDLGFALRFSDFEMFFRDIFWSFQYFFTAIERYDPQYFSIFCFKFMYFWFFLLIYSTFTFDFVTDVQQLRHTDG